MSQQDKIHRLHSGGETDIGQLREQCRAEIAASGLSLNAAARQIGMSGSSRLSQWLNDKYAGDNSAVARQVEAWITTRREAARRSLASFGIDSHRDLGITEEISVALSHAQAVGDVILVHGISGGGKTWAARRYCDTHSSAYYLRVTQTVFTLPGLLGRVGHVLGIGERHGSALNAETAIVNWLDGRGALLVIDEAHHLSARLLDELRCIRDIAGCGLALIGDDSIRMTLARCPQITGRIRLRVGIRRPADVDVAELVEGILHGRPSRAELRLCTSFAAGPGGLHALRGLFERAGLIAAASGRDRITGADLGISAEQAPPESVAA